MELYKQVTYNAVKIAMIHFAMLINFIESGTYEVEQNV